MDILFANRLSTLGHPQRLAVFRLLMRRYPDRVPATEVARALDLKPNTFSTYVSALMQVGLVNQERRGTSLRYSVDIDAARRTIEYLMHDCCRGRPEICAPDPNPATAEDSQYAARKLNVLFVCTGNSARSILAETILRDLAGDRFEGFSAGTSPHSGLNPFALNLLEQKGHDVSALHSKHLSDFQGADAPDFDFVFTVCDQAANEECPAWQGQTISAHWGLPDPVKVEGTDGQKSGAFQQTYSALRHRLTEFTDLPFSTLDRSSLQKAVDDIGQITEKDI